LKQKIFEFQEIIAQCRFLTSAGFDTTANTLAYLLYLLSKHYDVQENLRSEIDNEKNINFDTISQMPYLQCVVAETLRLFPHAAMLQSRRCMQDCLIGDYKFAKDLSIIFDTWSLHYDVDIWGDDANDRFGRNRTRNESLSWMPFGMGARQCVGMRFALLEIKATVCYLLKRFYIRTTNCCNVSRIVFTVKCHF
uniref:Cytochrome P450 n=1 Tax=Dracunculus medinensis TaxID=318479 RepID=A0A0N4UJ95_DRAME